jgi:pyruvate dehydrogenase E1 component beta subunit
MVKQVEKVLEAHPELGSIEVIDPRTLWPLDMDTILTSVTKTGRCVVVHEAPKTLGLGGEIAARIQEEAILHLDAPVVRVTALDLPFPPFSLEKYFIPDENRILQGIKKALEF